MHQFALVPGTFAVVDTATGERFEIEDAVARLRWRWNKLEPSEPRMPRHAYVVLVNLSAVERQAADVLEFLIEKHPTAYLAYWRGYTRPWRYLEPPGDGFRYWRSRLRVAFVNRARPEDSEPVRRVDEGAKPIRDWPASEPWHPPGWWGTWKREYGRWVYHGDPRDPDGDSGDRAMPKLFELDS